MGASLASRFAAPAPKKLAAGKKKKGPNTIKAWKQPTAGTIKAIPKPKYPATEARVAKVGWQPGGKDAATKPSILKCSLCNKSVVEGQMAAHPELIEPVTEAQMAQIAALVEGVEPD